MDEAERQRRIREAGELDEFTKARLKHARNKERKDRYVETVEPPKKSQVTVIVNDPAGDYEFRFDTPYLSGTRMGSQRSKDAYKQLFAAFIQKEFGKCQLL